MSVSQVRPGLYVSGLDSALNRSLLTGRDITLIVDASGLDNVSHPDLDGLQVLHVPIQDQPHAPLDQYVDLVAERIHQNRAGRTLVHCTAGRSRFEELSLRQAHEVVLQQRPFIRPNAGFWRQLINYEKTLFGRNTVRMVTTSAGVLPEAEPDSGDPYSVNI